MTPIRHEYGTPRYQLAPGVESPHVLDLSTLPPLPQRPGFYLLDKTVWCPIDGLTYRTWQQTIRVIG